LFTKLRRAQTQMKAKGQPPKSLIFGGGVVANSLLRAETAKFSDKHKIAVHLPQMAYCADNAAMLAGLAHHRLLAGERDDLMLPALPSSVV
jgi:tRNA A37 threonylcarbamoyltransferase TsaD